MSSFNIINSKGMYRLTGLFFSAAIFVPAFGFLTDTLFCFHCNEEDDIDKCRGFINCRDKHEACFLHRLPLDQGTFSYTTGCLAHSLCNQTAAVDGRGNCIQCCTSNFCNNDTQQLCHAATTTSQTVVTLASTVPVTPSTQATTATVLTSDLISSATSTATIPCVDSPNVDCKVVAPDVCGKDDHFTYSLCRRTCGSCGHHGN